MDDHIELTPANVCEHGQLGRVCLMCEMRDELVAERAKVKEFEKDAACFTAQWQEVHARAEAAEAKVARLREAAIVALNYIESAEREVGIMSCGEALRRALGPEGGAA